MTKKEAFDFLYGLAEGVSKMFGKNCETLIQEFNDDVFCTVAIFNGHVSGREVNSTQGILGGILTSDKIDLEKVKEGVYNQLVHHPLGKTIKSSSFPMVGEDYTYIFGINYDVTEMDHMGRFIEQIMSFDGELFHTLKQEKENTMESILSTCMETLDFIPGKIRKKERLILVRMLDENNFFQMQRSVPYLSEQIGVSKYTIYKDLNEIGTTDVNI